MYIVVSKTKYDYYNCVCNNQVFKPILNTQDIYLRTEGPKKRQSIVNVKF